MTITTRPPRWRPFSNRPFLATLIGILVAAVVATIVQITPQSSAAELNNVEVNHHSVVARLKDGTTNTCIIENRATFRGNGDRVREMVRAVATTGLNSGMKSDTATTVIDSSTIETDLILSFEHEMTDPDAQCSTGDTVEAHRGRSTLELPSWARGMVASAAGLAVYLAVVFSVTALFAFLAPELAIYGELVGGCVGGFASTFVSNYINQVPQSANLTASAVQCIAGAILNISLGSIKQQMVNAVRGHVENGLNEAVAEGISHGAGAHEEMAAEFTSARSQFSVELDELAAQVGD
jgi:hypothetical protein